MLAILTDSKPAISTVNKLDTGEAQPRSEIEARILGELSRRSSGNQDTCVAWVKGHKGIKGNEEADKLCRETSILGHESEGVVTPAGLRAWSKRVRAEARGGSGEGILGWHRKAISAYTWCNTEKGPQRKWLHKIKKKDTPGCHCHRDQEQPEQSGEHLVEECSLLAKARELVEKSEMREWRTRHSRNQLKDKKEKGPVEPEKEKEKEMEKLELFFCHLYEFHNPTPSPSSPVVHFSVSTDVPSAVISSPISHVNAPVSTDVPSAGFSVTSSVNLVAPISSFTCIESIT